MFHRQRAGSSPIFRSSIPGDVTVPQLEQGVEELLHQLCTLPRDTQGSLKQVPLKNFRSISRCLQRLDQLHNRTDQHQKWELRPRLYTLLRSIDALGLMQKFDGFTDKSLPFNQHTLPAFVEGCSTRDSMLAHQWSVLCSAGKIESREHHFYIDGSVKDYLGFLGSLGNGGTHSVDCVWSRHSLEEYARKHVFRSRKNQQDERAIIEEIAILKKLNHVHLVQIAGSYTDRDTIGILLSPVAQCDLQYWLDSSTPDFVHARTMMRQFFGCLAGAVDYLHMQNIRHRDIKPQNVLVESGQVYITDFDTAWLWSDSKNGTTRHQNPPGTPEYMAPETAVPGSRDSKSDMWSLGLVFLDIFTVLKGRSVREWKNFLRRKSKERGTEPYAYDNVLACKNWLQQLKSVGEANTNDNHPLEWIAKLLEQLPTNRPDSKRLIKDISDSGRQKDFCCHTCHIEFSNPAYFFDRREQAQDSASRSSRLQTVEEEVAKFESKLDESVALPSIQTAISVTSWLQATPAVRLSGTSRTSLDAKLPGSPDIDNIHIPGAFPSSNGDSIRHERAHTLSKLEGTFGASWNSRKGPNSSVLRPRLNAGARSSEDGDGASSTRPYRIIDDDDSDPLSNTEDYDAVYGPEQPSQSLTPIVEEHCDAKSTPKVLPLVPRLESVGSLSGLRIRLPNDGDAATGQNRKQAIPPLQATGVRTRNDESTVVPTTYARSLGQRFSIQPPQTGEVTDHPWPKKPGETADAPTQSASALQLSTIKALSTKAWVQSSQLDATQKPIAQGEPAGRGTSAGSGTPDKKPAKAPQSARRDSAIELPDNDIMNIGKVSPVHAQLPTKLPWLLPTHPLGDPLGMESLFINIPSRKDAPRIPFLNQKKEKRVPALSKANISLLQTLTEPEANTTGNENGGSAQGLGFDAGKYIDKAFKDMELAPSRVGSTVSDATSKRLALARWMTGTPGLLSEMCDKGKPGAVQELLRRGFNAGTVAKPAPRPLLLAMRGRTKEHNSCVRRLIEYDCDVNAMFGGKTPIHRLVEGPYFPEYGRQAALLLRAGAMLDTPDRSGNFVLLKLLGSASDSLEDYRVQTLAMFLHTNLPVSVNVNVKDPVTENTALHLAIRHCHPVAVGMLVHREADVNAGNATGATPLSMAANQWRGEMSVEQEACLKYLIRSGRAKVDATSGTDQQTALHLAVLAGAVRAVELLLEHKASPKVKDRNGKTPLALLGEAKPNMTKENYDKIALLLKKKTW